jgi:hypothetical protein
MKSKSLGIWFNFFVAFLFCVFMGFLAVQLITEKQINAELTEQVYDYCDDNNALINLTHKLTDIIDLQAGYKTLSRLEYINCSRS